MAAGVDPAAMRRADAIRHQVLSRRMASLPIRASPARFVAHARRQLTSATLLRHPASEASLALSANGLAHNSRRNGPFGTREQGSAWACLGVNCCPRWGDIRPRVLPVVAPTLMVCGQPRMEAAPGINDDPERGRVPGVRPSDAASDSGENVYSGRTIRILSLCTCRAIPTRCGARPVHDTGPRGRDWRSLPP